MNPTIKKIEAVNGDVSYEYTTYKTIQDIEKNNVWIVDTIETFTQLGLDLQKTALNEQIAILQEQLDAIDVKNKSIQTIP